jgi:hypothetical protein
VYPVQTAQEMLAAVERLLPVDAAVFAAAVADWRIAGSHDQKIKKKSSGDLPVLKFAENPDILARVSAHERRPQLVVGFAAVTEYVMRNWSMVRTGSTSPQKSLFFNMRRIQARIGALQAPMIKRSKRNPLAICRF